MSLTAPIRTIGAAPTATPLVRRTLSKWQGSGSPNPRAELPHAARGRELLVAAESGDALDDPLAVEHHNAPLEARLAQLD
ncbi:hypothetical protein [Gulosibacter sediminis]|uniref:hypothetical protein n=1 Tax=Gulosibacter sediminis TaxID=1729695 RepID=UPI0024AD2C92|nr:hypothetical protein [Gulosibacter sediminis]